MIIYGAQYYRPPFPERSAWKSDLLRMKQCHFNTVKLWAVWSWIERKEGEFYFEDLDEIISLCAEVGLNVVINTIPEGMPYWLSRRHADARYQTSAGLAVEMSGAANMPSGGSPGLCPDKPEVQARTCGFIRRVVERYAGRENVTAFDVWNEPHIEPIFDYPDQLFCYCEHSKARFIEWLRDKYGSLDALNRAWLRAYSGWEDVLPPARFGTYPDMIDWRLFWLENLGRWLDARVSAARGAAHGKTVMTHVPFSGYIGGSGEGGLGYHLGDEFILSPRVDKFGLTSFPKWLMNNDFVQHLVNIELVASASEGRDFWQSELQSGAGKWEAHGRSQATPEEIRLWNWSAVACGAKGVMYWQWKPEPSGMEAPGFGLTRLDGGLSPRAEEAGCCAEAFSKPDGFDGACRVPAENAVFVSRTAALWWHAAHHGEALYAKSLYGVYRACFDAGIPVRMLHADHLAGALKDGLKVLYVPAAAALSDTELAGLRDFASSGGTLVVEACPGLFDERGVLRQNTAFIEGVFGLSGQDVDAFSHVRVKYESGTDFSGRYYRQDFDSVSADTAILGRFDDDRPAVFRRQFGKGQGIFIGTFAAAAVGLDAEQGAARFITAWMHPAGFACLKSLRAAEKILVRLHRNGARLFASAVNYNEGSRPVSMTFKGKYRLKSQSDQNDRQGKANLNPGGDSLSFQIPGRDGLIIELEEASKA